MDEDQSEPSVSFWASCLFGGATAGLVVAWLFNRAQNLWVCAPTDFSHGTALCGLIAIASGLASAALGSTAYGGWLHGGQMEDEAALHKFGMDVERLERSADMDFGLNTRSWGLVSPVAAVFAGLSGAGFLASLAVGAALHFHLPLKSFPVEILKWSLAAAALAPIYAANKMGSPKWAGLAAAVVACALLLGWPAEKCPVAGKSEASGIHKQKTAP